MRISSFILGFALLASTALEAKTSENFQKRFQIIRDESGKLVGVRDRTLPVKFEVAPYVKMIKEQIIAEQSYMNQTNAVTYEDEVKSLLELDEVSLATDPQYQRRVEVVVDSLKELATLNVDNVFKNPAFNEVVSKYQDKMTDAILMLDPTMIAMVNDPSFFYKKNVTYQVVSWGLDFARKRLSQLPILNTASFIIVQVEKKITERRNFHQNMLLHYLENFTAEELGLTHDEVNLVWSSIYESRIPWYAFWESNNAKANWTKYGVNNFYAQFRAASATLRNSTGLYGQLFSRPNYAFQEVTYKGDKVIINLFDQESMFEKRPAVAFNYDKPTQVVRKRVLLSLAELGLSFVSLPAIIKDNVTTFIKSYYEKQRITEGALYGYFESQNDQTGKAQIKKQYLNPFDVTL